MGGNVKEYEYSNPDGSIYHVVKVPVYDNKGEIMTSIPAAGSADLYCPNNPGGFSKHQDHDVATYKLAKKINRISDYYRVRPVWK